MVVGIFLIALGLIAVFAHKSLARQTLAYTGELYKTKLGSRVATFARYLYIFIGLIMCTLGLLALLGVVPTK